jgi:type I restriction enzyme S subunit
LDQADALRRLRRQSLSRLSDLGQAIFYEMFGDLSQSPRTHAFSDIAQIQKSLVDPRKQENWDKLHVGPEHIEPNSGNIDWSRVNTAKSDGLVSGKNEFDETSVIYSKIRPNLNKVALPDRSGLCSADMYVIKPRNGMSNRIFLQALMMTRDFLAYAETVSNRANIPKLNREQVDAYRFGCPSQAAQNEFERLVNTIKNQKDKFTLAHSKANSLFASLQHRAFRGEI